MRKDSVRGHQPESFNHGLGDEQPVEGVAMMPRQLFDGGRVHVCDRKRFEMIFVELGR